MLFELLVQACSSYWLFILIKCLSVLLADVPWRRIPAALTVSLCKQKAFKRNCNKL